MTNDQLPGYTDADVKAALLAAGASGTVYSLVMPESEAVLSTVMDGASMINDALEPDRGRLFELYHEPWSQKQDGMHEEYFRTWAEWAAPVVSFPAQEFVHRYPTAGASEGIYKLMAEYAAVARGNDITPTIHIFDGEYEGFAAFAAALDIRLVRHQREHWGEIVPTLDADAQFWISQPSAIDGMVWNEFEAFAAILSDQRPDVQLIPDLTYVGSVARGYSIALDLPNIPAFLISQSKPLGGYYHRVGGVFAKREYPSLFGNKWFKNLLSLRWATTMMLRYDVHHLPNKYRPVQIQAAKNSGALLGIEQLAATDVMLMAKAPKTVGLSPSVQAVLRGTGAEEVIRLCVSPGMACLIDPKMAPTTAPDLLQKWNDEGLAPLLAQEQSQ